MPNQNKRWRNNKRSLRAILLLLIATVITAGLPNNAHAYEGEHYVWTYYLALHVGFTKRQAFQIASATYAVDWDKDTGPMEVTLGDVAFGANHMGFTGTKHPAIARIWFRFHSFKLEEIPLIDGIVLDPAERIRRQLEQAILIKGMDQDLWSLAKSERNPGPYLHWLQDSYSHGDYDIARGHVTAGHKVDYLSYDQQKAKEMTDATIKALSCFMVNVLKKKPMAPKMERIYQVLSELIEANPVPSSINPRNWSPPSGPSLAESWMVVNNAIDKDERDSLLPLWPDDSAVLPAKWYQFDFTSYGTVTNKLYPVEELKLEIGGYPRYPTVKAEAIDAKNVRVKVSLPYKISGALALPLVSPLPVIEQHLLTDAKFYPRIVKETRWNGDYITEFQFERPISDLISGKLVWECSIQLYGLEPIIRRFDFNYSRHYNNSTGVHYIIISAHEIPQLIPRDNKVPIGDSDCMAKGRIETAEQIDAYNRDVKAGRISGPIAKSKGAGTSAPTVEAIPEDANTARNRTTPSVSTATRKRTVEEIPEPATPASRRNTPPPQVEAIPEDNRTAANRTNTPTRKPTVEAIPEPDNNERDRRPPAPTVEQIPDIVAETRRPPSRRTGDEEKIPDIIASTRTGTRSSPAAERTSQNSGTGSAQRSGWTGKWVGDGNRMTFTLSGDGSTLSGSFQYNYPDDYWNHARGSGTFSNCKATQNEATCEWRDNMTTNTHTSSARGTITLRRHNDDGMSFGSSLAPGGTVSWKGGKPLWDLEPIHYSMIVRPAFNNSDQLKRQ